jgi:hypothetical protein
MPTVNYANTNLDQTVRIFDNFYRYDVQVPAAEYDVVYSYFKNTMKNERAAGNFTVSVFQVAQETNVPPLTLLQNFEGTSGIQLNATLAYYLNQVRSRATLLGVGAPVVPNVYAARNVLQ